MTHNKAILWISTSFILGASLGYLFNARFCHISIGSRVDQKIILNQKLRKLWTDHVVWTRCYIIAALADAPDAQATAQRLLKNQDDIGAAIASFYGSATGNALSKLLREHILIATKIIQAAKEGNPSALAEQDKLWHENADAIAQFLSEANPAWSYEEMKKMFYEHLALTTQEVTARLNKDWEKDIATFDKIYDQILSMADGLDAGIVKQFPQQF